MTKCLIEHVCSKTNVELNRDGEQILLDWVDGCGKSLVTILSK